MLQVLKFKKIENDTISFYLPEDIETRISFIKKINSLLGAYNVLYCQFDKPRKKISTGRKSQNSHIWGHITQIARETGNDIEDVEITAKMEAVKRGYPIKVSTMGNGVIPKHINNLNTKEAALLIETLHQIAADMGICLIESEEEEYI